MKPRGPGPQNFVACRRPNQSQILGLGTCCLNRRRNVVQKMTSAPPFVIHDKSSPVIPTIKSFKSCRSNKSHTLTIFGTSSAIWWASRNEVSIMATYPNSGIPLLATDQADIIRIFLGLMCDKNRAQRSPEPATDHPLAPRNDSDSNK